MKKSLSTKLFFNFMMVIIVLLISVCVGISYLIYHHFFEVKKNELLNHGQEIIGNIDYDEYGRIKDAASLQGFLNRVDRLIGARIWVLDKDKKVLFISVPPQGFMGNRRQSANIVQPNELKEQAMGQNRNMMGMGKRRHYSEQEHHMMRYNQAQEAIGKPDSIFLQLLAPVYKGEIVKSEFFHPQYQEQVLFIALPIYNEGKVEGALLLSSAIRGFRDFILNVYLYIGLVMVIAIAFSLVLVRHFSKETIAPLLSMQKSAAAMAKGDYSQAIETSGDDEVSDLGESLNSLAKDLNIFVDKMTRLEKLRRDFVANVSHELRTPLTIIRGYNEAMLDKTVEDPDKIASYQVIIRKEIQRLERLISDLLDISRLQAGRDSLEDTIPLDELVRDVADKLQIKADAKNINVNQQLDSLTIQGNGDRLVQLVLILLDNAIKFTPEGGTISLSLSKHDDCAKFCIKDSGRGIPPEDLPYIWERFFKVDKSHSRQEEGTGLGLAIAKEIMLLHKAEFDTQSQLDVGTTITIYFPLKHIV